MQVLQTADRDGTARPLGKQLPFVLFDKHFDTGFQFLDVLFLEEPKIALDSIIVIDPLFLHHAVMTFVSSNQHWHRTSSLFMTRSL
jgi:hypothetical protein